MAKYRTDLAVESKELFERDNHKLGDKDGIVMEEVDYGEAVKAVRIEITSPIGELKLEKPMGNYITIESEGIVEEREGIKERVEHAVAEELKRLVTFHYNLKVLVIGLGNSKVTPDALGPETASKIKVTRHLFIIYDADGDDEMANVSCLIPNVTAETGMETADLIRKAAELTEPEVIIVIDSLAARDIKRVSTTVQITDTGISPGAGMGNHRTGINRRTAGAKVIAIGVPTVIDAGTIIKYALAANIDDLKKINEYIEECNTEMIVTSTDIDMIIKEFSDIIAGAINKTLHPGIYF